MSAPRPTPPARVLVADDDTATRELLEIMVGLQPALELVALADNGEEALRLAVTERVDIALLDHHMPGLDGLTVAELLRAYRPETQVVLYTAAADTSLEQRARSLGLRLVTKGAFDQLTASLGELAAAVVPQPAGPPVEAIVLSALGAQGADGVLVVSAGEQVLFYNSAAAGLIGLELPARPLSLQELRQRWRPVQEDGSARELESLPIERARREQRPITDEVWKRTEDAGEPERVILTVVPHFSAEGEFLGAAVYVTTARRR